MSQLKSLTSEEKDILLPIVIKLLKTKSSVDNPLVSSRIINYINSKKDVIGFTCKFSNQRLMKLINYIRMLGILPIISGSDGYYVSYLKEDIHLMIKSLQSRIDSISSAQRGLRNILTEIREEEIRMGIKF